MPYYNKEQEHISTDNKYNIASEFFHEYLLHCKIPSESFLNSLYKPTVVPYLIKLLESSMTKYIPQDGILRKHEHLEVREIALTRQRLNQNKDYLNIHYQLIEGKLPSEKELQIFFGHYTEKVRLVMKTFLNKSVKRKCGLLATSHHNRVGALIGELGFNEKEPFKYSAIGSMHDSAEDLLNIVQVNNKKFGISKYSQFLDYFIPKELQPHIMLLTNNYDLIINEVSARMKAFRMYFTKDAFNLVVEDIYKISDSAIRESIENMNKLFKDIDFEEHTADDLRWLCYRGLFIKDMARHAERINDYRTFQTKAVDLCDNAHGSRALDVDRRIKNILKLGFWAKEGFGLKTTWTPVNNYVMEVLDDALIYSENLVITDLLEETSEIDFLMSSLIKINKLQSIFYTNKDTK